MCRLLYHKMQKVKPLLSGLAEWPEDMLRDDSDRFGRHHESPCRIVVAELIPAVVKQHYGHLESQREQFVRGAVRPSADDSLRGAL